MAASKVVNWVALTVEQWAERWVGLMELQRVEYWAE